MKTKYILITASSKGLGLEIAKMLSFAGYNIILTSRDKKNLNEAKSILNPKLKHKSIEIDFENDNIDKKLIDKIKNLNLVAIVHSFGIKLNNDTHPIDINILERSIYNNFIVSLKINNVLSDKLKGNPSKIIYIGSTASLHAKASPSYTLSKSLINTYIKNISQEYLKSNIMICGVLPGILGHKDSEWDNKRLNEPIRYEEAKKKQPLGKFALPLDIAKYIVDLVNQDSLMFTGSVLKLDANEY